MKQRNGLAAPGPQHATPPPPERLPSPALQPISAPTTWGTRQRIAEHLSKLDQESLDHLLDKVARATLSTAAVSALAVMQHQRQRLSATNSQPFL